MLYIEHTTTSDVVTLEGDKEGKCNEVGTLYVPTLGEGEKGYFPIRANRKIMEGE